MADFSVRPADIRTAAGTFDAAGDELNRALGALFSALAGSGGMAGADKPGVQFSTSYDAVVPQVEHLIRTCVTGLGSIGDGLRAMADNYGGSDTASTLRPGDSR
ncbi:hypothetical protein [Frankia sp. R82]|uniref:hypothetical protein n=1 Tax=Frankia sp. R82 TaxID=2950553 RepID=UPI002042E827|nr:hypothetical protein [Frankia sp. R82]MCM3883410.1 hypothetical protein [Frankia sp. R82]